MEFHQIMHLTRRDRPSTLNALGLRLRHGVLVGRHRLAFIPLLEGSCSLCREIDWTNDGHDCCFRLARA